MTFIGPNRPWLYRSNAEDISHAKRERNEWIDAYLSDPRYEQEMRGIDAYRAQPALGPVETLDSALYDNERYTPSRPLARWEERRGLKQAEEWTR